MFWTKTVDAIVADFTKVIDKLNIRAAQHSVAAAAHAAQVEFHQEAVKVNLTESARAAMIAGRINKLINV